MHPFFIITSFVFVYLLGAFLTYKAERVLTRRAAREGRVSSVGDSETSAGMILCWPLSVPLVIVAAPIVWFYDHMEKVADEERAEAERRKKLLDEAMRMIEDV